MQVAKWGNSLAIRIPSAVVDALDLKEGDDIVVRVATGNAFEIERDDRRQKALEKIRSFKLKLPEDWKFDREDANSR
ncbi:MULTISPECIES: AbrB/MazE/SpoVT family DNA-binding domain-containing protein [Rhizobium]|uniref:AbrB family transcriptional regulator n=1 Tax=Rhizobium tropici TaxID=398 RepID=A0A329YJN6_RHITR|nr:MULTISPECIES: AbrB/MazE/SpoVT family DNA-binding domain-containing protein [Rhizobium]MBB3288571.1 antitoxin MazE [Rhizobium sp. BK252]MBB3403292.1 antitoxin MazE [Rhizobium sp. BK289]MBB3415867.1 antitoxin MazE [Rhizobium sp. BK284]MBB3483755.1 antitoxin MazE [Rhizobium sp. BK347]MDK4722266.1 AbrB/MazE/SpoVT family DNA-binding domain-containing protein [Rhizobium sp. CNPSo 3968]